MPWSMLTDQGIHKGKLKVALNEKQKKLRGFSFSINIANFEGFLSVFKMTKNPLFQNNTAIHFLTFAPKYNIIPSKSATNSKSGTKNE